MNRALVIGIGDYSAPYAKLPAVAADVREIAKLLGSSNGGFHEGSMSTITGGHATKSAILGALEKIFQVSEPDDVVFVYMAGHGQVDGPEPSYYFVAHDTRAERLATTAVPLTTLKQLFDECKSRRAFLWLDFCHSGGIAARGPSRPATEEHLVLKRELEWVQGEGKMIFAACTSSQSAFEDSRLGHGMFTASLLSGLKGGAMTEGEVTITSLFDYIDRKMGSTRQRPMMFGKMEGRVVIMHFSEAVQHSNPRHDRKTGKARSKSVDTSGNMCLLGTEYFMTKSVRETQESGIVLEIPSTGAEVDAQISRLKPRTYGGARSIPYAFRNDGMLVRVCGIEAVSKKSSHVWTVTLKPESRTDSWMMETAFSTAGKNYSIDDLAKLRAGRILLNDPAAVEGRRGGFSEAAMLEGFIRGMNAQVPTATCAVQQVFSRRQKSDEAFLQAARLHAIFMLKAGGVCEHVLALRLGPVENGACHVMFRGQRRRIYSNEEPAVIELEGECPLY